jgi:hypothetical protein
MGNSVLSIWTPIYLTTQTSAPCACAGSSHSPVTPTALSALAAVACLATPTEYVHQHSEEVSPSGSYSDALVWRGPAWWRSRTAAAPPTKGRSNGYFARLGSPARTRSEFSRDHEDPIAGSRWLVELAEPAARAKLREPPGTHFI